MPLYVSSEVLRKVIDKPIFVNALGFFPFVLPILPNPNPQALRKDAVGHPQLSVIPFLSFLFNSSSYGLQILQIFL